MDANIIYEKPVSGTYPEIHFGGTAGNSMWVLFSDGGLDEWVGIFGHAFGHCGLMKIQPLAANRFMIFAGAAIYLVDAGRKALLESYSDDFLSDAVFDEAREQLIVADFIRLRGIRAGSEIWRSKRIALDGIHSLYLTNDQVGGLAEFEDGRNEPFVFDCVSHEIICKYRVWWSD